VLYVPSRRPHVDKPAGCYYTAFSKRATLCTEGGASAATPSLAAMPTLSETFPDCLVSCHP